MSLGLPRQENPAVPVYTGSTSLGICLRNEEVDKITRTFMRQWWTSLRGVEELAYVAADDLLPWCRCFSHDPRNKFGRSSNVVGSSILSDRAHCGMWPGFEGIENR